MLSVTVTGNAVGACVGSGVVAMAGVCARDAATVATEVTVDGAAAGAHDTTSSIKPVIAPMPAANLLICFTSETIHKFMIDGYCMSIAMPSQSSHVQNPVRQ